MASRVSPIINEKTVIVHQVKLKMKPDCVDMWCEMIKHRYRSTPTNEKMFKYEWKERDDEHRIPCSTLKLRRVEQGQFTDNLLTIQNYHPNQNEPEVGKIYIQAVYCRKWIDDELESLMMAIEQIYQKNITKPEEIQKYVDDNMPEISPPGSPDDLIKLLQRLGLL